ncbi:MAG: hypothetical protein PHG56_08095 [Tissierellia bacterium]|jgi:hypothetical protein|nr:hypothetical protein [Tissierellia bacterium]
MESRRILLKVINPIKYMRHSMHIDEIKETIWWEVCINRMYEYLDNIPAIPAAIIGLIIQSEISKTMLDTFNNRNRYKIVLSIVVINSANKYALNP